MKRRPWHKLALKPMMWASGVLTVVVTGVLTLFAQQQIVNPAARPPSLRLLAPDTASSGSVATALSGSGGQDDSDNRAEGSEEAAETRRAGQDAAQPESSDDQGNAETFLVRPTSDSEQFEIRLVFQEDEGGGLQLKDVRVTGADKVPGDGEKSEPSDGDIIVRVDIEPVTAE